MATIVLLSLSKKGWGEAILGIRVALQLKARGNTVRFVCHSSMALLFSSGSLPFEVFPDHMGPLCVLVLQDIIVDTSADVLILSDYSTCESAFNGWGASFHRLDLGIPVVGIDTWDEDVSGHEVDVFVGKTKSMPKWPAGLRRIIPVPFSPIRVGAPQYSNLPERIKSTKKQKEHIRHNLGLSKEDKLVLITTANWQQTVYNDCNGDRLAANVPTLLDYYLSQSGSDIHLIHIGPNQFDMRRIDDRYHWFPQMNSTLFGLTLLSCDLILSMNISATTIAAGISNRIPVVVMQNSIETNDSATIGSLGHSRFVSEWIEQSLPLYRFRMWPLGFYKFMEPLLHSESYRNCFDLVEITKEDDIIGSINSLLRDSARIADVKGHEEKFFDNVMQLPTGAEVISKILEESV